MNSTHKMSVEALKADGSNCATYCNCMKFVLKSHGWVEHLTETLVMSTYTAIGDLNGLKPDTRWNLDQGMVKNLITTSIPNSVFNNIKGKKNPKEMWDALKSMFEGHSCNLLMVMWKKLQNIHCGEEDDVHVHFILLADLCEQLASMGETITDNQFMNTMLSSLPDIYDLKVNTITTDADLNAKDIQPSSIVKLIGDEYDKLQVCKQMNKKKNGEDEAFTADAQSKDKKKSKKCDMECFNCHKKGHVKADCWVKGGGNEGGGPKGKKNKKDSMKDSTAAATDKLDDIKAWAVIEVTEEEQMGANHFADPLAVIVAAEEAWAVIEPTEEEQNSGQLTVDLSAAVAEKTVQPTKETELYDSGASC